MLTEAKQQLKVSLITFKNGLIREMLNKTTFITSIIFMIINNACFIVQWIILYSVKDNIGGYSMNQILLLWGIASGTYGVSYLFFKNAFHLSNTINTGKLDAYIVQPKNILIQSITSSIETSAIGDIIYAYIMYFIYGFSPITFILYTLFLILGGLMMTSISVILNSLSFWIGNAEMIANSGDTLLISLATYPDGIFKGVIKVLLYTLIPVGIINYLPVKIITKFNPYLLIIILLTTILLVTLSFIIFNKGLKRYSSSNLMSSRI